MSKRRCYLLDYGYLGATRVRGALVQSVCADTDFADTLQPPWLRTWDRSLPRTSTASFPGVLHSCAGKLFDIYITLSLQMCLFKIWERHKASSESGSQRKYKFQVANSQSIWPCYAYSDQKVFASWDEINYIRPHCRDVHRKITTSIKLLALPVSYHNPSRRTCRYLLSFYTINVISEIYMHIVTPFAISMFMLLSGLPDIWALIWYKDIILPV